MKLAAHVQVEIYPMLLGRGANPVSGDDLMPQLRLTHVAKDPESDAIPFPRPVSRIGRWQPRLAQPTERHEAEIALDQVNEHLGRLAELLNSTSDDDRPRAA